MIAEGSIILFLGFALLMAIGAPLAVALGVSGTAVILIEGLGIMSVPTNAYNGVAKYPLLALPVFILAGMMFERAGVALRIVRFASAIVRSDPTGWNIPENRTGSPVSTPKGTMSSISKSISSPMRTLWRRPSSST